MVISPEVNFDHIIIDPFADVLGTAWLDTFHYSPADVAIKIKRNVLDHIILFKFWVTPASFPGFDKNSLNEFMHQQMDWIESNVGGLDFFDLINIEVKEEKQPLMINSDIYVEFMFYLSKEKFDLASTLLKIKGYTTRLEQIYPAGLSMFYNCASLTAVSFPAGVHQLASHPIIFSGGV